VVVVSEDSARLDVAIVMPVSEEKTVEFTFAIGTLIEDTIMVLANIVEATRGLVRREEAYKIDILCVFPCMLLAFIEDAII